jgi:hypothetical protein
MARLPRSLFDARAGARQRSRGNALDRDAKRRADAGAVGGPLRAVGVQPVIDVQRTQAAAVRCAARRECMQQHGRIETAAERDDDRAGRQAGNAIVQQADQVVRCHARMVPEALAPGSRQTLPSAQRAGTASHRHTRGEERSMVIKRINVVKLAIFQACMGVAFGLLAALLFMLIGSSILSQMGGQAAAVGVAGGIAMLIFLPIMYGVAGFIFGAIAAALYNLIAGMIGGIEIETE